MSVISRVLTGDDGKLRPILRALLYAVLAFWVLSADELPAPIIDRLATALGVSGRLSAGTVAFYEAINLVTALLLTWLFALY